MEMQCRKCQKIFVRKKATLIVFKRQVMKHEGFCKGPKEPKQCKKCGRVFKRRYNLKLHMQNIKNCELNPQWDNVDDGDEDSEENEDEGEDDFLVKQEGEAQDDPDYKI